MKKFLAVALASLIVVVVAAAPSLAALPKKGYYDQKSHGQTKIALSTPNRHQVMPEVFNKCVKLPVSLTLKVNSKGHFAYQGTHKDVTGHPVKIDIHGTFTTTKVAVGYAHYSTAKCSAAGFDFRATYVPGSGS